MSTSAELEKVLGSRGRIRILAAFFENEDELLSIRQASMIAGMAYSKAHKYVTEMERLGVLKKYHRHYMINKNHNLYENLRNLFIPKKEEPCQITREAKQFLDLLKLHTGCGIYVHHNADPDAIGSAVALAIAIKKLGIECEIIAPASISAQSKALLQKYPYPVSMRDTHNHGLAVVVDTASAEQLPGVNLEGREIVIIDHHREGGLRARASMAIIDPEARACAVLVFQLLKSMNIRIDAQIAFFLAVGLVADTGFLRNATSREIKIMAELVEHIDLQEVMASIHMERDRSEKLAILKAMRRMEVYDAEGILVVISEIGSYEASCALAILRAGADVAIVANVGRDEIRISCRANINASRQLELDKIFKMLESVLDGQSGGHETALSFNGRKPENWDDAKELILKQIQTGVKKKIKRIA